MSHRRLTILHVVNSLGAGGMENGVVNLANGLEPRGIEFQIACLDRRGAFADRLPDPNRVMVLGKGNGFTPAAAWRLKRLVRQMQPDLIHTHNLGPLIYTGLATGGGTGARILHGEHSKLTAAEIQPRRLLQRRLFYRSCRAIHTVSTPMREQLLALGFRASKILVIPNGVDTTRFAPGDRSAARRALNLPSDAFCAGIVGRFGPYKRHALLLDAFDEIAPRFPRLHLVIAGTGGSEEATTRERVESSPNASRIHWLGYLADPSACYRALDLLAIPSVNEGLSNVALEAMASGVPVVGNAGCGHEEIISPGIDGVLSDISSPASLAAQLMALLSHPGQMAAIGARARDKVASRFSFASMADSYAQLYESLAVSTR